MAGHWRAREMPGNVLWSVRKGTRLYTGGLAFKSLRAGSSPWESM